MSEPQNVIAYLKDAGRLRPEMGQIEALNFEAHVDDAGLITFQSPSVAINPDFFFLMHTLRAAIEDPESHPTVVDKVSFNVLNEGRNKEVFKTPMNMAIMCGGIGYGEIEWNTVFRFFERADVSIEWNIDTAYPADSAKRFYVALIGEIVHYKLIPEQFR